jgi:hypothetical protein
MYSLRDIITRPIAIAALTSLSLPIHPAHSTNIIPQIPIPPPRAQAKPVIVPVGTRADLLRLTYPEWGIEFDVQSFGCERTLIDRMRCRIAMVKTKGPKLPGQLLIVESPSGGYLNGNGVPLNPGMPARVKAENGGWIDSYDVRSNMPDRIENGKPFAIEIHFQRGPKGAKVDRLSIETAVFMYGARKTVMFQNVPITSLRRSTF